MGRVNVRHFKIFLYVLFCENILMNPFHSDVVTSYKPRWRSEPVDFWGISTTETIVRAMLILLIRVLRPLIVIIICMT